jgi:P4 family phage/plasmid primase-like protien
MTRRLPRHAAVRSENALPTYDTLDDLANLPRWVAWREELRPTKDGQLIPRKIPYDPNSEKQASIPTDPATWGTRQQAEQRWRKLDDGRPGGIGVVLGLLDNGVMLMGIDLDSCIDEKTGDIAAWADDVLNRFDTYTEVSPSGLGLKLFFQLQQDDVEAVRRMMSGLTRKTFSAGKHYEIALDCARYYTVTNERLDGPETFAIASVDDVRWLLEECGPQFKQHHAPPRNDGEVPKQTGHDESGSGYGFRFMADCKRAGDDYEAAKAALLADDTPAGEWARRSDERQLRRANKNKVDQIIDALKAGVEENAKRDVPFWLDDDHHPDPANLIACRNGLLDITTRKLLAHTSLLFNTSSLPFDYDPDAPKPKQFKKFIRDLLPGDAGRQARQTLWEIFGLLLTPDTSFQKIFLFVGPKRSGKGTVARVLNGLLGKSNVVSPTFAGLADKFGLQSLINKRAAFIPDARLGPKTDAQATVERLLSISGEDSLTIERKYKTVWTGRLDVRFVILSNELPRLPDASGAFPSRLVVLTLQHSFLGREDRQLTEKLLTELPGILKVALNGLNGVRRRGHFQMPKSSHDALQQLEDLASPIGAFLRDWCVVEPSASEHVGTLYDAWCQYCQSQGMPPGSNSVFGRNLLANRPEVRVIGRAPDRKYVGVKLTEQGWEQYDRIKDQSGARHRS